MPRPARVGEPCGPRRFRPAPGRTFGCLASVARPRVAVHPAPEFSESQLRREALARLRRRIARTILDTRRAIEKAEELRREHRALCARYVAREARRASDTDQRSQM